MIELTRNRLQLLFGDPQRESIGSPFSFRLRGETFDAATTGHAMLAIRSSGNYFRENHPPVAGLFAKRKPTHIADMEALSDWLDAAVWQTQCEACKGTKVHSCNCNYCDEVKGAECDACEGEGMVINREWVSFAGVTFDRCLMARFLEPLRGESGEVEMVLGGPLEPFQLWGNGWVAVVMPGKLAERDKPSLPPEGLFREVPP